MFLSYSLMSQSLGEQSPWSMRSCLALMILSLSLRNLPGTSPACSSSSQLISQTGCWQYWYCWCLLRLLLISQLSFCYRFLQLFISKSFSYFIYLTESSFSFSLSLRLITSFFIFSQYSLYSSLISLHFYNSFDSSLFSRHFVFNSCFKRFNGDLSSCFLASYSSTLNLAFYALNLLSSSSRIDFSFVIAVFSSLLLLFIFSISSSLARHSLDTSWILLCNSCSMIMIFCSLLANSPIFPFNFVSNRFKLASIFLKFFSFSMSLFLCCSDKFVQNYISFCFRVIRVLASSAFFHVSSSQTTLYQSSFSSILCSAVPSQTLFTFYDGSLGSSTTISAFQSIRSLISNPRCFKASTGPKSYKQTKTRMAPIFLIGSSSSLTSSTGMYASNTLAKLSCFFLNGTVNTCFSSSRAFPSKMSFLSLSLCHNSITSDSFTLPSTYPAAASKYPAAKQFADKFVSTFGLLIESVGLLLKDFRPRVWIELYFKQSWAVNSWSLMERISTERRS